jgi:Ca2+-transporting ATPase
MAFQKLKIEEVFKKLKSSPDGISEEEAKNRLKKHGLNEIVQIKKISPLKIFFEQFKSILVIILIVAAIISYISSIFKEGSGLDAVLIMSIVVANAFFGFLQEYKAEKSIEALRKMSTKYAIVIRNGKKSKIDAKELVPGDIILVEQGDIVPADCRVIESKDLKVDESILTGESIAVHKSPGVVKTDVIAEMSNMLFMNTSVVRGTGKLIVVNTGMNTEVGQIAREIQQTEEKETPFQKEADLIGKRIGNLVLLISALVFIILAIQQHEIFRIFIISISLAVAAVPEGLPAIITLALSIGARKMVERNSLIRKLAVIESLGPVEVICTDKTGTLTENKMTVTKIYFMEKVFDVTGTGLETKGKFLFEGKEENPQNLREILLCGAICNNANKQDTGFFGDPTEVALLVCAEKAGIKKEEIDKEYQRVDEEPFSPATKKMITINKKGSEKIAFLKGAPEIVLKHCSKMLDKTGKIVELDDEKRKKILEVNNQLTSKALRVLGFARGEEGKTREMIFLGLQGMIDPPRKGVAEAIKECKKAGISVIMLTGDHINTAKAIAEQVGIEGKAITGEEIEKIQNLESLVQNYTIFARVSPHHKLMILKELQKKYIVAMTGDGVNDAPALKNADVGIAMGIRGSDVSKESSDIILLDDNFITIKNAIEEGRGIFDNIQKFLNYLLTANAGEVLIIFFGSLLSRGVTPLLSSHLLWLNLLTDGFPALALGVDPKSKNIMNKKPREYKKIFDNTMYISIISVGVIMTLSILPIFLISLQNEAKARTLVLTSLVMMEFIRLQIIRSKYHLSLFSNKYLLFAVLISVLLQLAIIYTPINTLFSLTPLTLEDWLLVFASFAIFLVLSKLITGLEEKYTFGAKIFK